ncbi:MAG TPA: Asp-tRNA(Asn)/Glu-tRNA(Gln) amidotransferase subunit GatA [Trichococcus sp.]|jgi:aspartyl-tRNA(Asn)/glutamyl-tRNA(Gln) amidotransferase subunit A|nr:Asp-tRNA(Asn)/Glu-tRNA(Gln) amidotransferase subunit GatA [Trichococcus sp.]MBP9977011.1 Asp-tRNA(Asn)/Glu-tRNA(Gln) amidotransferase subunit GatA [Trichococcus sp.]OUL07998.1 aspartyl/glutamyl-tRNA amidotransferase subunit A [Sedimentibacter sp. SX930]HAZ58585.1 Asp-tRNA(Asn)/Glu-tRNA(Gln) amidotransferase subunit GatA [Trichococcus sp.]HRG30202.1 Asp-tRNA(Asn)/Glu-tRNA(Gln) amidotransferase subunit GatA [Trichococcus flocculiformis]
MSIFNETLTSLHEGLVNKEFSSVELTQAAFKRIAETDGKVEAFLALNEEGALKQAQAADEKGYADGNVLNGIPLGIKDNIVTEGVTTTAASRMLGDFMPIYDATVVTKLKEAGAVNVGKLNMDEFAMGGSTENSYYKKTKNAWDLTKVPGGSSGGSAAAVASGEVVASLGSDTGGSIRQPAAFNGIVGMKPTYGRVSRYGLIAFASSLDQIGPMTRNVTDNALLLEAISGYDKRDSTSLNMEVPKFSANLNGKVAGMKIALPKEYFQDGVSAEIQEAVRKAAAQFEEMGATVEEVSMPTLAYGIPAYYIIASSEASSNLQRFDGVRYGYRAENVNSLEELYIKSRSEGFGMEVKRRIMLGSFSLSAGFYDAYFKKAGQVRTLIKRDFANIFAGYDLILGPTTTTTAFGIGEKNDDPLAMYMDDLLTVTINLAGVPAISVPGGFAADGMPIGIQLIGNYFEEAKIYQAAFALEQANDYLDQHPNL